MMISPWNEEGATEIARRLLQERFLTWKMGGLFPETTTFTGIRHILEVGCGPGSWSLDVARTYPGCTIVGIDCSAAMIEYAQSLKDLHGLPNVHFKKMSGDTLLGIESQHVDLITFHWNIPSLFSTDWAHLLHEAVQIARPGGRLRIVEEDLLGQTNSDAHRQFLAFSRNLLQQNARKRTLKKGSEESSLTSETLLYNECQTVSHQSLIIDVSFGEKEHAAYEQCLYIILLQMIPLLEEIATQEELEHLLFQVIEEVKQESFKGFCEIILRWGEIREK